MKTHKILINILIIVVIITIIAFRLMSNKKSFENELKMVSEFNTTIPVLTDTVKYQQISNNFTVNGIFKASEEVSIQSETQGKIIAINAKTGDNVLSGQILAIVDFELQASQLEVAKINLEQAEKDMKRYEMLSKGDAITRQQYENARQLLVNSQATFTSARLQYDNSYIKSPFNGKITRQYIEKGSLLTPGAFVFDIVAINKIKCIINLTDSEVDKISKGQKVIVHADNYPGYDYEGIVIAIIVKANESGRYEVEVEVNNSNSKLIKPGMFGSVSFTDNSKEKLVTIPRKALAGSIKSPEVFVVQDDSVVSKNIEVMVLDDNILAVLKGLEFGEVIVTSGQINLVNGSKVKINN